MCLSFCIRTMEIIIKLPLLDCNKNGIIVNGIVQCLAHNKGSINISDYDSNNNFIIDSHQREKVILCVQEDVNSNIHYSTIFNSDRLKTT